MMKPESTSNSAILLCINYSYWPHAATAIRSILVSSPKLKSPIFIIYDLPNERWMSKLKGIAASFQSHLEFIRFNNSDVKDFKIFGRLSSAAYYRLFAPNLLSNYSKILYLDADLVVQGDITELLQNDFSPYALAARSVPLAEARTVNKNLERDLATPYFNSGVLVIDTNKWESLACTEHICNIIRNDTHRLSYADQCALNLFFNGNYKQLPLEWNVTRRFFEDGVNDTMYTLDEKKEIKNARANPRIIHYTGDYKPWHVRCLHPLRNRYWKHRSTFHWYPYGLLMLTRQLFHSFSMKKIKLVRYLRNKLTHLLPSRP